jgi:hypothetical protein
MVPIININNGIKEPTHESQNCNTNHVLLVGGYVKIRESLCISTIIWMKSILVMNHNPLVARFFCDIQKKPRILKTYCFHALPMSKLLDYPTASSTAHIVLRASLTIIMHSPLHTRPKITYWLFRNTTLRKQSLKLQHVY